MKSTTKSQRMLQVRDFPFRYGFLIVLVLVVIYFSLGAPNFFRLTTLISILHTGAPMFILATGLAFVIMTAKLDISVGSTVFLASAIGGMMITRLHMPFPIAVLAVLAISLTAGAI